MAKTPPGRTDGASGCLPAQGGHQGLGFKVWGLGFRIGNLEILYIGNKFPYSTQPRRRCWGLGNSGRDVRLQFLWSLGLV